jgi:hypothetical protein
MLVYCDHYSEGLSLVEALALTLDTWPAGVTPKIHFSSPSTAMRTCEVSTHHRVDLWY